jgi:ectoine hydroxylase-related dioxygenase (phytanoyl-CoA dioxygenase family)
MSASTMLTLNLEHDGFAVVEDVSDPEDIGVIHQAIENCLHRDDVKTRELGERGGAPQIIEIARPCLLAEEISRSRFFRNAKAFSENYIEHEVVYHFDHAIIKPPMNQRETAWHQDSAYSHRLNFAAQRLHWWLPLHDVSVEQGCMRFVRGSHKIGQLRHVSVGATSDAIRTLLPDDAEVVVCPLKAGSATVHLPATLHSTGPNATVRPRFAFILQFARSNWTHRLPLRRSGGQAFQGSR